MENDDDGGCSDWEGDRSGSERDAQHQEEGADPLSPNNNSTASSQEQHSPDLSSTAPRRRRGDTDSPAHGNAQNLPASPLVTPPGGSSNTTSGVMAGPAQAARPAAADDSNAAGRSNDSSSSNTLSTSASHPHPRHNKRGVPHVYHDFGHVPDVLGYVRKKTGGVTQPFPEKLHEMLDATDSDSLARQTVSWLSHGRAFLVHKPKEFTRDIMPRFFRQSKLTSFQRQLNLYGFRRITQGPDAGAYYHEMFLRGRPGLCQRMVRQKVKGTGHKQPADASSEPNFYAMERLDATSSMTLPHLLSPSDLHHPPDQYTDTTAAAAAAGDDATFAASLSYPPEPRVHGFAFTAPSPPQQPQPTGRPRNATSATGTAAATATVGYAASDYGITMSPGIESLRGAAHLLQNIASMRHGGQPLPEIPFMAAKDAGTSASGPLPTVDGPMSNANRGRRQQRQHHHPPQPHRHRLDEPPERDKASSTTVFPARNDLSPSSEPSEPRNIRSV